MGGWLSRKAVSLDGARKTVPDCFACHVNKHAWCVVSGTQHVSNGKEAFFAHGKFGYILLGRHFGLEEVAQFGLVQFLQSLLPTAELHLVKVVTWLRRLDLDHLNTIKQDDRDGNCFTPSVVKGGHSQLYPQSTYTSKLFLSLKLRHLW